MYVYRRLALRIVSDRFNLRNNIEFSPACQSAQLENEMGTVQNLWCPTHGEKHMPLILLVENTIILLKALQVVKGSP